MWVLGVSMGVVGRNDDGFIGYIIIDGIVCGMVLVCLVLLLCCV